MAIGLKFQFHKGTIKTEAGIAAFEKERDFNSIKVRLKQKFEMPSLTAPDNFNSIKVRLKLAIIIGNQSVSVISIP